MTKYLQLFLGLAGSAILSQAALIPTLQTTTPGVTPGTTSFFYTVSLAADQTVDTINPSQLTIFDFDGYVGGSLLIGTGASDWTGVAQVAGTSFNLVFNYTGPTVDGPVSPIFDFTAISTASLQKIGLFEATASKNSPNPVEDNLPTNNGGSVAIPDFPEDTVVPEPATMSLVGGALVGLALLGRRRNSRS